MASILRVRTRFLSFFDALFIAQANAGGNLLLREARKCRSVVHRAKNPPKDAQKHPIEAFHTPERDAPATFFDGDASHAGARYSGHFTEKIARFTENRFPFFRRIRHYRGMQTIRTILVDDERRARTLLAQMLAEFPRIEICGQADHADAALALIEKQKPDLVFLDVQMPSKSGFELLDRLSDPPPIIFVTAYDQFAVHAFEVNAVDYLLKPVLPERLRKAVERIEAQFDSPDTPPIPSLEMSGALTGTDMIKIEADRTFLMRPVQSLLAIQAEDDYSRVFLEDRHCLTNRTMSEWENLLPISLFARLDRSLIINLQKIDRLDRKSRSEGHLYLCHREQPFQLGRAALKRLRKLLDH
jgi:two-component system LytT family response regulator